MKKLHLITVATGALLLAACGGGDPAESIDAIRHTEQAQLDSIASKDLVGAVRLYRDDARLLRPDGSVLDGGAAIADAYGDLMEDPNFALTIEPQDGWASSDGELAVVTSTVSMTTTDPATSQPVTTPMTSQTVWTRETGGTWKIVSAYNAPAALASGPEATEAPADAMADAPAAE
jgi:ketosteroid isomerase-like protein